jgi:transposase-like protein
MRHGQTRYDAQFRADAVACVGQSDKSLRKIAGDLGVAPNHDGGHSADVVMQERFTGF